MEPDQRMNPTGYEETELTYNVPEETVSASGDQGQKGGGFEDGIDTECGLDDHTFLALIYILHLCGITAKKYKDSVNVH